MKKISSFLGMALMAVLLLGSVACSKKAKTASDAAEKAYGYLQKADYESFYKMMDLGSTAEMTQAEIEAQKAMMVALLEEKFEEEVGQKGGIDSFEAIKETVSEDGNKAEVMLEVYYKNDPKKADTTSVSMVLVDGEWRVPYDK